MKNIILIFALAPFVIGCQSNSAPRTPIGDVLPAGVEPLAGMNMHYECVLYFDQTKNEDGVTQSIDAAVTIGEHQGMSPTRMMNVYRGIREEQEARVLAESISIAENRKNLIPRISGGPPSPTREEQLKAWEGLYGEKCNSLYDFNTATT